MIDGLFKRHIDPLWEGLARPLVALGFSANQVTLLGLFLVAANAGLYLWHRSTLIFGLGLAFSFAADALDGAVARLRNNPTRFGGYLDAIVDRYQECFVLLAIAAINDLWLPASIALAGALITSYAKARTAIETPIDNKAWPDLFERQERVVYICLLLGLDGLVGGIVDDYVPLLTAGLWLFAGLVNFTALQRIMRARQILLSRE